MAFGGLPTPPPVDPDDARAMRRFSEDHQRQRAGAVQDAAIIGARIWRAATWPVRLVTRAVRGRQSEGETR